MQLLAVLGLAHMLWAADPSIGTRKLNAARCKFAPSIEALAKEETVIIREVGEEKWRPQRDSNPCCRIESAVS